MVDRVTKACRVHKVLQAQQVLRVHAVDKVIKAYKAHKASQARQALRVQQA